MIQHSMGEPTKVSHALEGAKTATFKFADGQEHRVSVTAGQSAKALSSFFYNLAMARGTRHNNGNAVKTAVWATEMDIRLDIRISRRAHEKVSAILKAIEDTAKDGMPDPATVVVIQ